MDYHLEARHRAGSPTVCRFSEANVEAIDASAARLRRWAVVRDVQPQGEPFLRLGSDARLVVHLPIAGCADPQAETGIIPGRVQPGHVIVLPDVRFGQISGLSASLQRWLERQAGLAGPAEFHAGPRGFAWGELVFPVTAVPRQLRGGLLATA